MCHPCSTSLRRSTALPFARAAFRCTASVSRRATSPPSVRCGSVCDSNICSFSSPCRHSASIAAFNSQRPPPSARNPVARPRQLRVHLRQHLLHFARALARRPLDQLLPRRGVQHRPGYRCRIALAAPHRCRRCRFLWCAVIPRRPAQPPTGSVTARRTAPAAVAALEQVLHLRRVAQLQRAVLQQLARPVGLAAQPHRLDPPPGGGRGVVQFVHHVVEQTAVRAAQVEAAHLDLAQVVEDQDLQRLLVPRKLPRLRQEEVIGERGDGGPEGGTSRITHTHKYIMGLKIA